MPYVKPKPFYTLLDKVDFCLENGQPFVLYRKPTDPLIKGVFQSDNQLHKVLSFEEKGFVFAPFDLNQDAILLKPNETLIATFETKKQQEILKTPISNFGREAHLNLVEKGLQEIKAGRLQKVVLSRSITVKISTKPTAIFKRLLEYYPNAFCYLFFHPEVGIWCGATPETLVHIKKQKLYTMALAATLPITGHIPPRWSNKEREEHRITSEYISRVLTPILKKLHVGEAQSVKAGNLWHLCSMVEGTLPPETSVKEVITTLHPTPAVCGIPTLAAKAFIQQQEKYQRTFYTGFLGELNLKEKNDVSLFVNLRCMKLVKDKAYLFVGGGVTAASCPEREWNETQEKSKTLRNILWF